MNQAPYQPVQPQATFVQVPQPQIPAEYKPIGAWGYVGWQLLFGIPLVGKIMILVFALGGTSNINLKNFARSYLIVWLFILGIALLGFLIMLVIALVTGVGITSLLPWDEILSGLN